VTAADQVVSRPVVVAADGVANPTGAVLAASFPSRPMAASWPATEADRGAVVDRVLAAPFALDNPGSQQTRRLGVLAVLGWLRAQSGESWQQRWRSSGAEEQPDWRRLGARTVSDRERTPTGPLARKVFQGRKKPSVPTLLPGVENQLGAGGSS